MNIDIVIIGINTATTLRQCLESVLNASYSYGDLTIYYVDGGSKDNSVAIAKEYPKVNVIELHVTQPTPGLGRNKGWQTGTSPLIQFLDSDTTLNANWLNTAYLAIQQPQVAAVRGFLRERFPEKSIYNWIGDQEWNDKPGETSSFGGNALLRREVLNATGGYNDSMIAGEDPELSLRVRLAGWKIIQLDSDMATHDLGMTTLKQYWRRSYRTGYAYATLYALHANESKFWQRELLRIRIRGGLGLLFMILGLFLHGLFFIPGIFLLFYPLIFNVKKIAQAKQLTMKQAIYYALHCSMVVIPQFFGTIRYTNGSIESNK